MKNRTYLPGFDWVKLFGSMLIVLAHTSLNEIGNMILPPQIFALFGEVVPIFFLISGYLMYESMNTKERPVSYMLNYILKYGLIYFIICFINNINIYVNDYKITGMFSLKSFIADLCTLPFFPPHINIAHLWFIPPLLVGIFISFFIYWKKAEKICLYPIIILTLFVIIWNIYGYRFDDFLIVQRITSWSYFDMIEYFFTYSVRGIFFVFIGMWIAKYKVICNKLKLRYFILLALIISGLEFYVINLFGNIDINNLNFNITICLFSIIFFIGIIRLKGQFLKKYHIFISLFSGITYFIHFTQEIILRNWIDNGILIFILIILFNFILTILIMKIMEYVSLKKLGKKNGL